MSPVEGLSCFAVQSCNDVEKFVHIGMKKKALLTTFSFNANSCGINTFFQLTFVQKFCYDRNQMTSKKSIITLIDLAER